MHLHCTLWTSPCWHWSPFWPVANPPFLKIITGILCQTCSKRTQNNIFQISFCGLLHCALNHPGTPRCHEPPCWPLCAVASQFSWKFPLHTCLKDSKQGFGSSFFRFPASSSSLVLLNAEGGMHHVLTSGWTPWFGCVIRARIRRWRVKHRAFNSRIRRWTSQRPHAVFQLFESSQIRAWRDSQGWTAFAVHYDLNDMVQGVLFELLMPLIPLLSMPLNLTEIQSDWRSTRFKGRYIMEEAPETDVGKCTDRPEASKMQQKYSS